MPIWLLKPIDPTSTSWENSRLQVEGIIVRADTERDAIGLVASMFRDAKKRASQTYPKLDAKSQWEDAGIFECLRYRDSEFSEDGPPAILNQTI